MGPKRLSSANANADLPVALVTIPTAIIGVMSVYRYDTPGEGSSGCESAKATRSALAQNPLSRSTAPGARVCGGTGASSADMPSTSFTVTPRKRSRSASDAKSARGRTSATEASGPGISPRSMAMPTSVEVTLLVTDIR